MNEAEKIEEARERESERQTQHLTNITSERNRPLIFILSCHPERERESDTKGESQWMRVCSGEAVVQRNALVDVEDDETSDAVVLVSSAHRS